MHKKINRDTKTEIIPVRCRKSEKEKLELAAQKKGKSLSEYMLDSGMAGKERRVQRDKKRVVQLIEEQENINDIQRYRKNNDIDPELGEMLDKLIEGVRASWDC